MVYVERLRVDLSAYALHEELFQIRHVHRRKGGLIWIPAGARWFEVLR